MIFPATHVVTAFFKGSVIPILLVAVKPDEFSEMVEREVGMRGARAHPYMWTWHEGCIFIWPRKTKDVEIKVFRK